jgi:molybdopterin adenylyltransferase
MADLIRIGVLTVSDRCSRGEQEDLSGLAIVQALPQEQFVVALQAVVPDEKRTIAETLRRWCDIYDCNVILTTGGTGLSPRDVTPEATEKVIDRPWANLSHYLLMEGLKQTPFAPLSRGIAGMRGATVIVNLPGSPEGARQGTQTLLPLLPHAVAVLKAETTAHPAAENASV